MKEQKLTICQVFELAKKQIEVGRPYLIAEAGVNYYEIAQKEGISLLEAAVMMIEEASQAGANAVKFQAYKADRLASKEAPAYWDTSKESTISQHYLFQRYDKLEYEEYKILAGECEKRGIEFLCTSFDEQGLEAIAPLVPVIKIASADITNLPLMKEAAQFKKPVLLSTGASKMSEIFRAVEWLLGEGCPAIGLLHCVLSYPTDFKDANLGAIRYLKKAFPDYVIGYSDHCLPDSKMLLLTLAFLYGAVILEKHFTLDKTLSGNDHYHAMDPADIKSFLENIEFINAVTGKDEKDVLLCEKSAHIFARRSIVANRDISKGEEISLAMLSVKRPGTGLKPEFRDLIVGRLAKRDIKQDMPITWDDIL